MSDHKYFNARNSTKVVVEGKDYYLKWTVDCVDAIYEKYGLMTDQQYVDKMVEGTKCSPILHFVMKTAFEHSGYESPVGSLEPSDTKTLLSIMNAITKHATIVVDPEKKSHSATESTSVEKPKLPVANPS